MIYYFSGTGNSLHLASIISRSLEQDLCFIPDELSRMKESGDYKVEPGDYLGLVFPVHAWGPPKIVLDLIDKMVISDNKPYVFSIATCAEEEGRTTEIIKRHLLGKGLILASAFTVIMPNSYILGYDAEPKEIVEEKLKAADLKAMEIIRSLQNREVGVFDTKPGSMPLIRSGIVNTVFKSFGRSNKRFSADDNCDGCELCQKICPLHSISVTDRPTWSGDCTMCLACLNRCPTHAIQYVKKTEDRGRYVHPDLL
ncbi:MAG: EFR1 family ferrodoxin [Gudongella sp.]|nr:EFR1 family ferrodoxin [Gudongella sp.]